MSGRLVLLNVGQGDSIILHQPDSAAAAVIDCALPGASQARDYLRDESVEHIVGVIVTHLDDDHYAGIPELIKKLRPHPKKVAYGLVKGYRKSHPQVNTFLTQMDSYQRRYGFTYVRPEAGLKLGDPTGGLVLEFLGPNADEERIAARHNNANFASALIRATIGSLTAILPGDVPPWRWGRLRDECPSKLRADVLVVPHHGAAHIDNKVSLLDLLTLVSPTVVAISVGSRNRYGHPRPATLTAIGKWARQNNARLVCTQLNEACAVGGSRNGVRPAPLDRSCAGRITVEHGAEGATVKTEQPDHRLWVENLAHPRCSPVPTVAP